MSIFIPFPINWIPLDILRSKLLVLQAPSKTTAGCLVAGVLPSTILLTKKETDEEARKIVFPYDTVTVEPANGVTAFGNVPPLLKVRQPAVRIIGPDPIIVHASNAKDPVRVRFFAQTEDMRGVLNVTWTISRGRILSQHDQTIEIEYPATNGTPGDIFSGGRISVQVVDEDSLLTSNGRAVRIEVRDDPVHRPPVDRHPLR